MIPQALPGFRSAPGRASRYHRDIKAKPQIYKTSLMNPGPRPLPTLLHTLNADLGMLLRHAEYLQAVRKAVTEALPEAAADHIHVATIDRQQLVLHTDSTGWATRLRYAETAIQRGLAQRMRLHVERVLIRVRPALARTPTAPIERHISSANCDYMRRIADHVDDAELARALRTLSNHGAT